MLAKVRSLIQGIFRRAPLEQRMDDELRFHIAAYADDLERRGMSRTEAERIARAEFAGLEGLKEECREARGLRIFDELSQDFRYALRGFRKSPGFVAIAILTLALGTGANAALFSAVKSWVLEPLPFAHPDRLVAVWSYDTKRAQNQGLTPADYYDWRSEASTFEEIAAWNDGAHFALTGDGDPDLVRGARVTSNFFRMLAAPPALGRDFVADDDQPGAAPVAIISDSCWRSRFGAPPGIVGRTIKLDDEMVTIVGVLGPEFQFALMGRVQIWKPLALSAAGRQDRTGGFLNVTARLKPNATLAQSTAQMQAITRRLEQAHPETNRDRGAVVRPLAEEIGLDYARELLAVFGIVVCVLLIACINVANLMVTRATGRQREFAVRLAMGAGQARLVRQILTENVMLFIAGAALGLLFAIQGAHWLSHLMSDEIRAYIPNFGEARIDLGVCAYTLLVSLLTGLVFGFAPALETARADVNHRLKQDARSSSGGGRLKNVLIVFETALALTVLISAGLMGNSLVRIFRVDAGFDPRHVAMVRADLSPAKYKELRRAEDFYKQALDRIRAIPGIENAAATRVVPFGEFYVNTTYRIPGAPEPATGQASVTAMAPVTPDYFATLGVPLLSGRVFDERDRDDSQPVVIINQTMARRYWPGRDPIGQHLLVGQRRKDLTIAGVAKDVKLTQLTEKPSPQVYLPYAQARVLDMRIVVRSTTDPAALAASIRAAIWSIDRNQPISEIRSMDALIREQHAAAIYVTQVISIFGLVALVLAAIGIYGVTSYAVAARKQEIGIRIALGATKRAVIAMILRQGMSLAAIGLALGAIGSVAVTRLLASLLFDIRITDVATFAAVGALLGATALAANFVPARKAAAADPAKTLRHE